MKYASSFVVGLFLVVVALVESQDVPPRGIEYRVRGGSSGTIVADFDNRITSQARERRIKGEKETVSDEDEKVNDELVTKVDEKDEKETPVDKGDDKLAKKEKPAEEQVSAKEAIKETDKLVKEESSAPNSTPEETTSPAPSVSPTCVECDDFGR